MQLNRQIWLKDQKLTDESSRLLSQISANKYRENFSLTNKSLGLKDSEKKFLSAFVRLTKDATIDSDVDVAADTSRDKSRNELQSILTMPLCCCYMPRGKKKEKKFFPPAKFRWGWPPCSRLLGFSSLESFVIALRLIARGF